MYTRPMYNSEIILKLRVCAHVMCNAPCPAFIPKYLFRSRAKRERKLNARMCSHWNYLGPVSTLCTTNIDQRGRYFPPPPEAIFRLFLRLTERFCGTRDVERLMTRVAVILTLFGRLINRAPNDRRYRFGVE